jgi:hypothetical protein
MQTFLDLNKYITEHAITPEFWVDGASRDYLVDEHDASLHGKSSRRVTERAFIPLARDEPGPISGELAPPGMFWVLVVSRAVTASSELLALIPKGFIAKATDRICLTGSVFSEREE